MPITKAFLKQQTDTYTNNRLLGVVRFDRPEIALCKKLLHDITYEGDLTPQHHTRLIQIIFSPESMSVSDITIDQGRSASANFIVNVREELLANCNVIVNAREELLFNIDDWFGIDRWTRLLQKLANYGVLTLGAFNSFTQCKQEHLDSVDKALTRLMNREAIADLLPSNSLEYAEADFRAITHGYGEYAKNIAKALVKLSKNNLLPPKKPAFAQANRDSITQGNGEYAINIAKALVELSENNLLPPENPAFAQANRESITQGNGKHATNIANTLVLSNKNQNLDDGSKHAEATHEAQEALGLLDKHNLLPLNNPVFAQSNRDAVTQNDCKHAMEIATALVAAHQNDLLPINNHEFAKANRDPITQNGGKYMLDIIQGLIELKTNNLISINNPKFSQMNRDIIMQGGGQYAQEIACTLVYLHEIGFLSEDGASSEFCQMILNAITQDGGKYAEDVADAIRALQPVEMLPKDTLNSSQSNLHKLFQAGAKNAEYICTAIIIYKYAIAPGQARDLAAEGLLALQAINQQDPHQFQNLEQIHEQMQIVMQRQTQVISSFTANFQSDKDNRELAQKTFDISTHANGSYAAGFSRTLETIFSQDSLVSKQNMKQLIVCIDAKITNGADPRFLLDLICETAEVYGLNQSTLSLLTLGKLPVNPTDQDLPSEKTSFNDKAKAQETFFQRREKHKNDKNVIFNNVLHMLGVSDDNIDAISHENCDPTQTLNTLIILHECLSATLADMSTAACTLINKFLPDNLSHLSLINEFALKLNDVCSPDVRKEIMEDLVDFLANSSKNTADSGVDVGRLLFPLISAIPQADEDKESTLAAVKDRLEVLKNPSNKAEESHNVETVNKFV
jgi:hypothetical protein